MQRLYLMRHGQTVYNLDRILQGRCDSPLTELGIEQARRAGAWLRNHGAAPVRLASSPLPRAHDTLDIVMDENPSFAALPRSDEHGLIERCYGTYEEGPLADLPVDPWVPGDALVEVGGDTTAEALGRMTTTIVRLLDESAGDVLCVSHGSVVNLFRASWERLARCPQDVHLKNCCILVFDYDPAARTFSNTLIVNP